VGAVEVTRLSTMRAGDHFHPPFQNQLLERARLPIINLTLALLADLIERSQSGNSRISGPREECSGVSLPHLRAAFDQEMACTRVAWTVTLLVAPGR
jgi:hypothetical protein